MERDGRRLTPGQHRARARRQEIEERVLDACIALRLSGAWVQMDAKQIAIHVPGVNRDGTLDYDNTHTTLIPRKKPTGA